jgi:hypothetical protein
MQPDRRCSCEFQEHVSQLFRSLNPKPLLGLNAFHSYRRRGESPDAQRNRELCPCCHQAPETPTHFLLECPAYSSPRSLLLADAIADAQSAMTDAQTPASLTHGEPAQNGPAPDAPGHGPRGLISHGPAPTGPALDASSSPAPSRPDASSSALGSASAQTAVWRVILDQIQPGVIKFVQDAWYILTGRGANGGNPMALPPVP